MTEATSVVHVIGSESEELGDEVVALSRRLPPRFRLCVVGRLSRSVRARLSQRDAQWVNMEMPDPADRQGHIDAAEQLARVITSFGADIIHSHGRSAQLCAFLAAQRVARQPALICSLYADGKAPHAGRIGWGMRRLRGRSLAAARVIVASTEGDRDVLRELEPRLAERLRVVPQGIERRIWTGASDPGLKRASIGLSQDAAIVGLVSPLRTGLGIEGFLGAAARVLDQLPNVEFVLLGEGPDREELQELAHSLRIGGAVVFLGKRADTSDIIPVLNLLVLTSDAGGGPYRGLQALAANVAVVYADTRALREAFAELPQAAVYPEGNVERLREVMQQQLEAPPADTEADVIDTGETGIAFSREDMLVSGTSYDLDTPGLDPQLKRAGTTLTAAEAVESRYSVQAMTQSIVALYDEVTGRGRA
jgi:glycosyltransferase involved in cell wall biosynthesis